MTPGVFNLKYLKPDQNRTSGFRTFICHNFEVISPRFGADDMVHGISYNFFLKNVHQSQRFKITTEGRKLVILWMKIANVQF